MPSSVLCEPCEDETSDARLLATARFTLRAARNGGGGGEATLGGVPAASLVCWKFVGGKPCASADCQLAHCFRLACGGAINEALDGPKRRRCRFQADRCNFAHPTRDQVRAELGAWWREARGTEPLWDTVVAPESAARGGERSDHSAGGGEAQRRCTVPAAVQLERLRSHEHESPYLREFLDGPHLERLLECEPLRALLGMRRCAKELTEAYGAVAQVRSLLAGHELSSGLSSEAATTGRGIVILDVCCGKGLTGTLLSLMLPEAAVIMLDANGAMDMSHVAQLPNVSFQQFDCFRGRAAEALSDLVAAVPGGHACVAVGTHLCGALSPRLIDLAVRAERVDALILCPCCLKGGLGAQLGRAAKARAAEPYSLLVNTLAALAQAELAELAESSGLAEPGLPAVRVVVDAGVTSPCNSFIIGAKARPLRAAHGDATEPKHADMTT